MMIMMMIMMMMMTMMMIYSCAEFHCETIMESSPFACEVDYLCVKEHHQIFALLSKHITHTGYSGW